MREVTAVRAAAIVGRSERTIRRHLKLPSGALPARKTHNGWRISLDELLKYYGPDRPDTPDEPDSPASPAVLVQHEPRGIVTQDATTGGDFKTHADAARWLIAHGIKSEGTPKTWPGWRSTPLTREDVLGLAVKLCDTRNHRITWRLRRCGDNECVCVEMLG